MDKKKKYNSPIIEKIAIDKSISLAMQTGKPDQDNPGGGGWDWGDPPGGGKTFPSSTIEQKDTPNAFEENPFK